MFKAGDLVVRKKLDSDACWQHGYSPIKVTKVTTSPNGNKQHLQLEVDNGEFFWGSAYFELYQGVEEEELLTMLDTLLQLVAEDLEAEEQVATCSNVAGRPVRPAPDFLKAGLKHMEDRAATYDAPDGERSMESTVEAFNALTGHKLTEEAGWLFMTILKMARANQGNFRIDNYEDGAAYFALMGEAASKHRK